ncbi:MAG: hypothetical protein JW819_13060 [Candidatus Krumholzibacteriota bacterium]|nr:hypothetical protein [Candidatus Krumholzibacteriota bacterium]
MIGSNKGKVWVIPDEPPEKLDKKELAAVTIVPGSAAAEAAGLRPARPVQPGREPARGLDWRPPTETGSGTEPATPLPAWLQLLAAYLPSGAALHLFTRGRRRWVWSSIALASLAWWILALALWPRLAAGSGGPPFAFWTVGSAVALLAGFAGWGEALRLAAADRRLRPARLPRWLRQRGVAGLLGLVVPGLGLLASGRPWRAAAALWIAGPWTLALLILLRARDLALINASAGAHALPDPVLNLAVLAAMVVLWMFSALWLGGALESARLAGDRRVIARVGRSDGILVALLITLIGFFVSSGPSILARQCDRTARGLEKDGLALAALHAQRAAMRLAPGEPEYALKTATLYDTLDRWREGAALRGLLRERYRLVAEARHPAPRRAASRPAASRPAAPHPAAPPSVSEEMPVTTAHADLTPAWDRLDSLY